MNITPDITLVVQILQFLHSIYVSKRSSSNTASGDAQPKTDTPNPEHLQELIREIKEESGEQTDDSVSRAIDRRFVPAEAQRIKDDLAAFMFFATPPDFADYNFIGMIQKYLKGIQSVAVRADLFRIRGEKAKGEVRYLLMDKTAKALLPNKRADDAVYEYSDIISASVVKTEGVLTDEHVDIPFLLFIGATFQSASITGYGGMTPDRRVRTYRLSAGQEDNWLRFRGSDERRFDKPLGFDDFEFRLSAQETGTILAALRSDIVSYLREVEKDRPKIDSLREDLRSLITAVSSRRGSC